MGTILVRQRFTKAQCHEAAYQVQGYFARNPRRKICNTDIWGPIRKGKELVEILKKEQPVE